MKLNVNFDIEFKKNPYPGKFIALEGIDGSGKTTHAQMLCRELQKKGYKAHCTKEPTDGEIGKFIRRILSGELKVSPVGLQYLFNADRAVHQEEIIEYLKKGDIVVTDRYFWSSVAYGVSDLGVIDDYYFVVYSMLSFYNRFLLPDVTFYLNISAETGTKRISGMDKKKEIYENKNKLVKIKK